MAHSESTSCREIGRQTLHAPASHYVERPRGAPADRVDAAGSRANETSCTASWVARGFSTTTVIRTRPTRRGSSPARSAHHVEAPSAPPRGHGPAEVHERQRESDAADDERRGLHPRGLRRPPHHASSPHRLRLVGLEQRQRPRVRLEGRLRVLHRLAGEITVLPLVLVVVLEQRRLGPNMRPAATPSAGRACNGDRGRRRAPLGAGLRRR
jgi:hypothetical protein